MTRAMNHQDMARRNREAALMEIRRHPEGISRLQLAERLGLVRSAITKIATQLVDSGAVREEAAASYRRHEPRSRLFINPDWAHVVTLSLMYELAVGVVDFAGNVVWQQHLMGDGVASRLYTDSFDQLVPGAVSRALAMVPGDNLLGIGVLSGGFVDRDGIIHYNNELPRRGVDMREVLADVTDLPVHTDQELRLLLQRTTWAGSSTQWRHVVALNPGRAGDRGRHALVLDGELYYGASGLVGIPGRSVPMPYAAEAASMFEERVAAWGGEAGYLQKLAAGDPQASEMYRMAIANYGARVAHAAACFNPDAIVLYTPYCEFGDAFLGAVREAAGNEAVDEQVLRATRLILGGRRHWEEWLAAAALPVLSRVHVDPAVDVGTPGQQQIATTAG
jgi:predicted NBD/HSP70 family sugar kinase